MARPVEIDTRGFQQKLYELKRKLNGVEMKDLIRNEAKQFTIAVLKKTPPYGSSKGGTDQRVGEAAVKRDIARAVRPVRPEEFTRSAALRKAVQKAAEAGDVKRLTAIFSAFKSGPLRGARVARFSPSLHTSQRDRRGHVNKGRSPFMIVGDSEAAKYAEYLVREKSHVGFMRSGFIPTMKALQIDIPAYVSRHAGRGSYGETVKASGLEVSMLCGTNLSPGFASTVKFMLKGREKALATKIARLVAGKEVNLGFTTYDPNSQ